MHKAEWFITGERERAKKNEGRREKREREKEGKMHFNLIHSFGSQRIPIRSYSDIQSDLQSFKTFEI